MDAKNTENIYERSIAIVNSLLKENEHFNNAYSEAEKAVVRRVIHATSDVSYAGTVFFTGSAAEETIKLIKKKTSVKEPLKIACDSEMTKAGISRNVNKNVVLSLNCRINSLNSVPLSGVTRSAFSINSAIKEMLPDIIIIGNAPTALFSAMECCGNLYKTMEYKPFLIIGMPVGFVDAAKSKAALFENNFYKSIGNFGNLGGSAAAASAMNALLREANPEK